MKIYKFSYDFKEKNTTIRNYLSNLKISNQTIKDLTKKVGLIKVNSKTVFINHILKNKDIIELTIEENEKNEIIPIKKNFEIYFEDDNILVAYKEKGIATIPSFGNYDNSLANFVTYHEQQTKEDFVFRALNRLDKDAEGFVIIVKNKLAYSLLKDNVHKIYSLYCFGNVKNNVITSSIATKKNIYKRNEMKRIIDESKGKISKTKIISKTFYPKNNISYCRVEIETGRTHQIRLHFSSQGNFLLGDKLYGNDDISKSLNINSLQLYCNEIYLFHPFEHRTFYFKKEINFPFNLE